MNFYAKYVFVFLILIVFGALYDNYKKEEFVNEKMDQYDLIKKYLLNDSTLARTDKPILWIPIVFETNARWWANFASRNSQCFNQPYQYLTIKSIIDHCGESFNVCLIDDRTFNKIIPGWSTKVANLPNPLRPHLRELAMAKLLYSYGGMTIPSSIICLKDLKSLYNKGLLTSSMFCGELTSGSNVATLTDYFPSNKIMGCNKNSPVMEQYINYLERVYSSEYTNDVDFTREADRWLYEQILKKNIMPLDSSYFGVKTANNEPVLVDDLLGDDDNFTLSNDAYCVYIPGDKILSRSQFQWFARMSPEQVLSSNNVIARYLLLATRNHALH